ncbi:hypothetical protein AB0L85_28050 [Streptomyces sp. NPDC052051]|uniref:hypothetical protein n=1 Tax=Streptomyces sp. NPDC052051 TaxID=3154649 RepID=UPI00342D3613
MERLFSKKGFKKGLGLSEIRDQRFKLSPESADRINPLRPFHPPDIAALSDKLGTDANVLGSHVSAKLGDDASLRAGIRQEDLRFITYAYAHNEAPSRLLNTLDHAIVYAARRPRPTSVLYAFENGPPENLRLPSAEQLLRDVRAQLGHRGGAVAKKGIQGVIDAALKSNPGIDLTPQELSLALATGRLRRIPDDRAAVGDVASTDVSSITEPLRGLTLASDDLGHASVRAAAEDFALQRYANALGRKLRITFANGSTTDVTPEGAGTTRLPVVNIEWTPVTTPVHGPNAALCANPRCMDPVHFPDGGRWTVTGGDPAPVSASGRKRGHDDEGASGGAPRPKRPRPRPAKGKARPDAPGDPDTPMGGVR